MTVTTSRVELSIQKSEGKYRRDAVTAKCSVIYLQRYCHAHSRVLWVFIVR